MSRDLVGSGVLGDFQMIALILHCMQVPIAVISKLRPTRVVIGDFLPVFQNIVDSPLGRIEFAVAIMHICTTNQPQALCLK
ncbi:Protein of unknown function [Pyronema omphalodes CBS 100304]|uniref:Uncharacterized protein n=1 Tax=Pyronema omphalodes (strain CBS 100304) TaxID=1076935 RepID=U4LH43_PYROM|nr:Protein of unknown function [Pyronema omphalodes CBS 100304]